MNPYAMLFIPISSVEDFIQRTSDVKIVINGSDLEEHIDLFKQVKYDVLIPVKKKSSYFGLRMYYAPESKKNGKLFDVAIQMGKLVNLYSYDLESGTEKNYIDKNYKVRRFDKRTKQTITITKNKLRMMDVKCTEKGIYVQKYKEKLMPGYWNDSAELQDTDDPESCDVYYMDLDGKNMERIAD